ncbi:MAG: hypothetical protein RR444_01570 [Oscillospiraceae bacterium]
MDFPYYANDIPYFLVEAITIGVIIGLVIGFAIAFTFYLFNAIGLYQISKRRGYKNAWISFIPVVNSYVLGAITDNINACYMKKSNYRIWLVVLNAIGFLISVTSFGLLFGNIAQLINQATYYGSISPSNIYLTQLVLISSITSLISIVLLVLTYICEYKIYSDYAPNSATIFLILSILFRLSPFFMFTIRNKPSASLYYAHQRVNQAPPPYQQAPQYAPAQPYQQAPYQEPIIWPEETTTEEVVSNEDDNNNKNIIL